MRELRRRVRALEAARPRAAQVYDLTDLTGEELRRLNRLVCRMIDGPSLSEEEMAECDRLLVRVSAQEAPEPAQH